MKEPIPGTLGAAVRQIRMEQKLSQGEVAKRAGIRQTDVSRIEIGERSKQPQEPTLIKLADALGVPPSRFFELSRFPEVSFQIEELREAIKPLTADQQKILAYIASRLRERKIQLNPVDNPSSHTILSGSIDQFVDETIRGLPSS